MPIPVSIRTCHYWLTSTWTVLTSQYRAWPNFHNRHDTMRVMSDTGSVMSISTASVLAEYRDKNASSILSFQYNLSTVCQYQPVLGLYRNVSTGKYLFFIYLTIFIKLCKYIKLINHGNNYSFELDVIINIRITVLFK